MPRPFPSAVPGRRTELRPGRRLSVAVSDRAGGSKTVLFIHGAGGRKDQWREVWPLFAGQARLVAWDAPGHGDSPAPATPRALGGEEWVRDALALIETHGRGPVVLAAHSYGTRVALEVMARLAGRAGKGSIAGALLLGPPPPGASFGDSPMAREPLWKLVRRRRELEQGFRAMAWSPSADPALVTHEERKARRNRLSTMQALMRGALPVDPAAYGSMTTAVTLLAGADDQLTPPDGARALAAVLPNSRCEVLKGCGHQIMLERPAVVREALARLLDA